MNLEVLEAALEVLTRLENTIENNELKNNNNEPQ